MPDEVLEEKQSEIQRLTQQLDCMEQELQEKYRDVGKAVLETAERESKEINQLVDEVIKVKKELVRVKGEIRCPNCYQYNAPGSAYCKRCGVNLEEEKEERHGE